MNDPQQDVINRYAIPLTAEEWDRIRHHIAAGPSTTYLDTSNQGTCVIFAGGVMHPRCYLEIVEDDSPFDSTVDIFAHVPGSLQGRNVKPYKP